MANSKSSQTTRNVVIVILALWSIISIIIIVVWATSAEMKGASECRTEMKALTEKHEGSKIVWTKDRKALEELVRQGWRNQTLMQKQIDQYKDTVTLLNQSLETSIQENVILNGNITNLESKIEEYKIIERNLSVEITLQKDEIENLEHNLTLKIQEMASCNALHIAAQQLQSVAETQTKSCETTKQYLNKQLTKCKSSDQSEYEYHVDPNSGARRMTSSFTLAIFTLLSLFFRP